MNIIHDGEDATFIALANEMTSKYGSRLIFQHSGKRYNDYGHSLREIGLNQCTTEFIMITNDDNYYVPLFLEKMFSKIDNEGLDLVLCDMIHSHNRPGNRDQGTYKLFTTFPQTNHIDMGAFIVRTEIAKAAGFSDKSFAADGSFIDRIMLWEKRKPKWSKVDSVLFVHN